MSSSRLTQEQLAAVGAVAINAGSLDLYLESCIWMLGEMHINVGLLFTQNMTMGSRASRVRDLVGLLAPQDLPDYDWIHSRLTTLITQRNTLIHGEWLVDSTALTNALIAHSTPGYVSARKPFKPGPSIHANEAQKISDRLKLMLPILQAFFRDRFPHCIQFGIAPLPRKSLAQLQKDFDRLPP